MGSLLIMFGMLLCSTMAHGENFLVINDSEATRYVGKRVEVWGLVVSVTTSPLGTSCISFEREYPDQMFAAFIAAGSKMGNDQRIAMLPGKIIGIIGTIELDKGKPEIEVTSLDQIRD